MNKSDPVNNYLSPGSQVRIGCEKSQCHDGLHDMVLTVPKIWRRWLAAASDNRVTGVKTMLAKVKNEDGEAGVHLAAHLVQYLVECQTDLLPVHPDHVQLRS